MDNSSNNNAITPNPALIFFRGLIGSWKTVGRHPYFPEQEFHGSTTFEWIEGGAFVRMHSVMHESPVPNGVAIFGSDDTTGGVFMLYYDNRQVSRKYNAAINDFTLSWWRDTPEFSQRFTMSIVENSSTIVSKGQMRKGDGDWEDDLELTYSRTMNEEL